VPLRSNLALVVAVSSAYIPVAASVVVFISALTRHARLSIAATLLVAAAVTIQFPWYYGGNPAPDGDTVAIRVLSSNLRKGHADPSSFVDLARRSADVLTVSELTPEAIVRFSQFGISKDFPYSVLSPAPGAGGIGLWSRYPLTAESSTKLRRLAVGRIRVPGVELDPLVASVHVISPLAYGASSFPEWRQGVVSLKEESSLLAEIAGSAAVIVGGDFNSTPDMYQFRQLLTGGYRDAVQQTGAGFAPTFPSNTVFAPILTIDHVMTRQASVTSIKTIHIPGSDHRALLATVNVPKS
jgi:endonuclease/exonuclease/phosphatase (EEP) superfamily protein YafD